MLTCYLAQIANWIVNIYTILLLIYAVASWIPGLRGRWLDAIASLIDPVLAPVRRAIPPLGGFDMAFLVVILVLQLLIRPLLANALFNACAPY